MGGRREAARRREAWRDRARRGGEVVRRRGRSPAGPRPLVRPAAAAAWRGQGIRRSRPRRGRRGELGVARREEGRRRSRAALPPSRWVGAWERKRERKRESA